MDKHEFDEMNRTVIDEFRTSGGTAGGVFTGKPLVLVHHIGAKSGKARISPLVPLLEDGRIFVFASKGGSETESRLVRQPRGKPECHRRTRHRNVPGHRADSSGGGTR